MKVVRYLLEHATPRSTIRLASGQYLLDRSLQISRDHISIVGQKGAEFVSVLSEGRPFRGPLNLVCIDPGMNVSLTSISISHRREVPSSPALDCCFACTGKDSAVNIMSMQPTPCHHVIIINIIINIIIIIIESSSSSTPPGDSSSSSTPPGDSRQVYYYGWCHHFRKSRGAHDAVRLHRWPCVL